MRALLFALALTACGPAPFVLTDHPIGPHDPSRFYLDPHGEVTLDRRFTECERETILDGFLGWTEMSSGRVEPRVVLSGGLPILRADYDPNTYGRTRWTLGWQAIYLDPGRCGEDAARTAAHELGHIMGLDHADDPECVMYSPNTGQLTFCQGDLDGICRLWGCP